MARKKQVECIIFRKKQTIEFLLLRRLPEKGGFWQPASGGLEDSDNSLIAAAYREIEEETGITKKDILRVIPDVHYFVMDKHYLTGEPIPQVEEFVFGFEVHSTAKVSIDNNEDFEHNAFKWVSYDEALSLLKWDNNKDALTKLNKLL